LQQSLRKYLVLAAFYSSELANLCHRANTLLDRRGVVVRFTTCCVIEKLTHPARRPALEAWYPFFRVLP